MSTNEKPAVASGGQVTRSGQPSCHPDDITPPTTMQLEQWRREAEEAKQAGDYDGFCALRVKFLNGQAAGYQYGVQQ